MIANTAPLIIVGGPTASGKSGVAIALAKDFEAHVLNIDSVQIYNDFNIGSGKITAEESRGVAHHLIDKLNPDEHCDAALYRKFSDDAISEIRDLDKQVIGVAGTTLYLKAMLHGLAELPAADEDLRQKLEASTSEELYGELAELDPETAATLHENDRLRVIRALEAMKHSGTKLSDLHSQHESKKVIHPALVLVLCWDRQTLYERIERRVESMLVDGLLHETKAIVEQYGKELEPLKTLGYKQVMQYLSGELDIDSLHEEISLHTRRFAKRQFTWWRNEPAKLDWACFPESGAEDLLIGGLSDRSPPSATGADIGVIQKNYSELVQLINERCKEPLEGIEVVYLDAEHLLTSLDPNH